MEKKGLPNADAAAEAPAEDQAAPETQAPAETQYEVRESFTQEDLNRARRQEKEKLYPEIDRLKQEVGELRRVREEQEAQEAARRAEQEAELKRKAEEEMDVRQLLQSKEQEWAQRLEAEKLERERAFAMLEQERAFAEVQSYRIRRMEEVRDDILPELIDFVSGDTVDQIESSIEVLKDRTSMILENARGASQQVRRESVGARVTAPPTADPLENFSGQRQLTPQDIRGMSMEEYANYRASLLGKGDGRGNGLFG